jgi:hypothetical protein
LIILWWHIRDRYLLPHEEGILDATVFLAGFLLVWIILGGRRLASRFAKASEQRMARWSKLVKPEDLPKLENDLRASRFRLITTIAQIGGGTALLVGIYFTYQNLSATREGQVTDRFIRAVDQLGANDKNNNPAPEIRLGGVYGLAHIAQDSREDYIPIRRILNDYIRINAPWPPEKASDSPLPLKAGPAATASPSMAENLVGNILSPEVHPRTDIQAALDFLGNPIHNYEKDWPISSEPINLPGTNLRGAYLPLLRLEYGLLIGAHLEGATLMQAYLDHANLVGAHLEHAFLFGVHLDHAFLLGAHLDGASLAGTHLDGAILDGAHLDAADFGGAYVEHTDLRGALGLASHQLDYAHGSECTQIPPTFQRPSTWPQPVAEKMRAARCAPPPVH